MDGAAFGFVFVGKHPVMIASLTTKQIRVDFILRNDIREGFDCSDANMVHLAKWLLGGTLTAPSCAYGCVCTLKY